MAPTLICNEAIAEKWRNERNWRLLTTAKNAAQARRKGKFKFVLPYEDMGWLGFHSKVQLEAWKQQRKGI